MELEEIIKKTVAETLGQSQVLTYPPIMRDTEVAEMCGCSVEWLREMRLRGDGPPILKIGRRWVRYKREDAYRWFVERGQRK